MVRAPVSPNDPSRNTVAGTVSLIVMAWALGVWHSGGRGFFDADGVSPFGDEGARSLVGKSIPDRYCWKADHGG